MKTTRILRSITALALALSGVLLCACTGSGKPAPTEEPRVTQAPEVEYTMTHVIRYWPEDADYSSCDYACVAEIPKFSKEYTAGSKLNKAVDGYLEELASRIETRYMPAAIAKPPSTEVEARVETANGVTNVIFTEKHAYEAQPYFETYVLMLNERGDAVNLNDVFKNYHADQLIASVIADSIAGDDRFYEADASKVLASIDCNHGASVQNGGCTVYVHEGLLAPYELGELSFDVPFGDVHPDFVGENAAMTLEEYGDIVDFLHFVSDAAVVRAESIYDGRLSEYEAASFMGELALTLGILPEDGRIPVPEEEFLRLYRECFGQELPGIDTEAHDIKHEGGFFKVENARKRYAYNVDILGAERSGDDLTLTGDMIFGKFGFASSEYVCHVTVKLIKNAESPFGFTLKDFEMKM